MDGALLYDGDRKIVVPDCEIHTYADTMGHDGKPLRLVEPKGVHPRDEGQRVTQIVLHWTASERDGLEGARDVLRNLSARKDAGCDILVTNDGVAYQYADLTLDMTTHVSHRIVRRQSIGIEVSCTGWLAKGRSRSEVAAQREWYREPMQGWRPTVANYFPAQQETVNKICTAICLALDIPLQVMLGDSKGSFRSRSNKVLREFEGVLGHLHCARGKHPKSDPGTRPLRAVAEHFAAVEEAAQSESESVCGTCGQLLP